MSLICPKYKLFSQRNEEENKQAEQWSDEKELDTDRSRSWEQEQEQKADRSRSWEQEQEQEQEQKADSLDHLLQRAMLEKVSRESSEPRPAIHHQVIRMSH